MGLVEAPEKGEVSGLKRRIVWFGKEERRGEEWLRQKTLKTVDCWKVVTAPVRGLRD